MSLNCSTRRMLAQPFLRPLSTSLANCICFAEDTAAEGWLPSKSQQDREETPTVPSLSEPLQGLVLFGVTDRVISEANFAFLFPGCLLSSGILCQTGHVHLCLLTALQLRQNKNLSACTKCCRPAQFHQHCHPDKDPGWSLGQAVTLQTYAEYLLSTGSYFSWGDSTRNKRSLQTGGRKRSMS